MSQNLNHLILMKQKLQNKNIKLKKTKQNFSMERTETI